MSNNANKGEEISNEERTEYLISGSPLDGANCMLDPLVLIDSDVSSVSLQIPIEENSSNSIFATGESPTTNNKLNDLEASEETKSSSLNEDLISFSDNENSPTITQLRTLVNKPENEFRDTFLPTVKTAVDKATVSPGESSKLISCEKNEIFKVPKVPEKTISFQKILRKHLYEQRLTLRDHYLAGIFEKMAERKPECDSNDDSESDEDMQAYASKSDNDEFVENKSNLENKSDIENKSDLGNKPGLENKSDCDIRLDSDNKTDDGKNFDSKTKKSKLGKVRDPILESIVSKINLSGEYNYDKTYQTRSGVKKISRDAACVGEQASLNIDSNIASTDPLKQDESYEMHNLAQFYEQDQMPIPSNKGKHTSQNIDSNIASTDTLEEEELCEMTDMSQVDEQDQPPNPLNKTHQASLNINSSIVSTDPLKQGESYEMSDMPHVDEKHELPPIPSNKAHPASLSIDANIASINPSKQVESCEMSASQVEEAQQQPSIPSIIATATEKALLVREQFLQDLEFLVNEFENEIKNCSLGEQNEEHLKNFVAQFTEAIQIYQMTMKQFLNKINNMPFNPIIHVSMLVLAVQDLFEAIRGVEKLWQIFFLYKFKVENTFINEFRNSLSTQYYRCCHNCVGINNAVYKYLNTLSKIYSNTNECFLTKI